MHEGFKFLVLLVYNLREQIVDLENSFESILSLTAGILLDVPPVAAASPGFRTFKDSALFGWSPAISNRNSNW